MSDPINKMPEHDENRIISLIGSLKRVEPPSDFDFKTKARIAAGRPTRHVSWFPASIRVAAPLALSLAVGGYFGLNYYYSVSEESVPAVVAIEPEGLQPLKPIVSSTASTIVANQFVASAVNAPRPDLVNKTSASIPNLGNTPSLRNTQPTGTSYDEAIREARRISQNGINRNDRPGTNAMATDVDIKVPTTQILAMLGISARFDGPAWRVVSVAANNPVVGSLIKPGDLIEAIDGHPLSGRTFVKSRFSGHSVSIRRDGRSIRIDLRP